MLVSEEEFLMSKSPKVWFVNPLTTIQPGDDIVAIQRMGNNGGFKEVRFGDTTGILEIARRVVDLLNELTEEYERKTKHITEDLVNLEHKGDPFDEA